MRVSTGSARRCRAGFASPPSPCDAAPPDGQGHWARDLAFLAALFGALLFLRLGHGAFSNPDEGRYAEVPREMLAAGDFVTPRLDGVAYFEKPPLVYWAVAGFQAAFGPGEASSRAVPVLFALAGILMVYAAARALSGRRAGLLSAVVLGSTAFFFGLARILILDMAVAVLMTATLLCFIVAVGRPPGAGRRLLFMGLYAGAALAVLTKGLIGLLVPGAVMFLWLAAIGQWRRLRPLHLPTGVLLFLLIAAPWHLLAAQRNPTWAHFYFIHEHVERYFSRVHGRYKPFWFFLPIVAGGLFPWTGFLWGALRHGLGGGWAARDRNRNAWFMALWAGFILLFFSSSQSKLAPYILPVFPPLAVLIGTWLAGLLGSDGTPQPGEPAFRRIRSGALRLGALRAGLAFHAGFSLVLATALVVLVAVPRVAAVAHLDGAQARVLLPWAAAIAAVLATGAVATLVLARRRGPRAAVAGVAVSGIAFLAALACAQATIQPQGTRALALRYRALAAPGEAVFHYHGFFHDFTYYSGAFVGLVATQDELEPDNDDPARIRGRFVSEEDFRRAWAGPARVWVVARRDGDWPALAASPGFHAVPVAASGNYVLSSNH